MVAARAAGRTVKMVGTGHSFTAIAARRGSHAAPGEADRDHARRPRGDDGHRPRGHPAPRAQRRAREPRALPPQHGRHRGADPGRRHLDRHPRHRRHRRVAVGAGGRPRPGHRRRDRAARRRDRATGDPGRGTARPRCPRDPHVADVPGRAALHGRGARGADALGRGARVVRPARRGEPLRGDVLVPAHRAHEREAGQPHHRPARAAPPLARLAGRRAPLQHGVRLGQRAGQPPAGAGASAGGGGRPGADRAPVQRRRAPGVHLASAGGVPRDGVRRPTRGRPAGAPRRPRPRRADAAGGSASRSRSA